MSNSNHIPKISDAEWVVMKAFWSLGEATSAEIISALDPQSDWKPKTVQTLIRRLVEKGALDYKKLGREYLYRPAIDERTCEQAATRLFVDRVFGGNLAPFLATFVEQSDYTDEELEELKNILEEGNQSDGDKH